MRLALRGKYATSNFEISYCVVDRKFVHAAAETELSTIMGEIIYGGTNSIDSTSQDPCAMKPSFVYECFFSQYDPRCIRYVGVILWWTRPRPPQHAYAVVEFPVRRARAPPQCYVVPCSLMELYPPKVVHSATWTHVPWCSYPVGRTSSSTHHQSVYIMIHQ